MFQLTLKTLREERGLSQQALADEIGVKQGAIGNWESGVRIPPLPTLIKLADYFAVSLDSLVGRESPVKNYSAISQSDRYLLENYHRHPEMQEAVDRLLGMVTETEKAKEA